MYSSDEINNMSYLEFYFTSESYDDLEYLQDKDLILEIESIEIDGKNVRESFSEIKGEIGFEKYEFAPEVEFEFNKEDYPDLFNVDNYKKGFKMEFELLFDNKKIIIDDHFYDDSLYFYFEF